jgi:hypothetical protein
MNATATAPKMIGASVLEKSGAKVVSTISSYGGTGAALELDGQVYQSGGNGWYYPIETCMGAPHQIIRDGGETYRQAIMGLTRGSRRRGRK